MVKSFTKENAAWNRVKNLLSAGKLRKKNCADAQNDFNGGVRHTKAGRNVIS